MNACESPRAMITINVNAIPSAPTVISPIIYCQSTTATALTAIGSNLLWYTIATGGIGNTNAPTPSTTNAGTTNYYVSQTVNTCESQRALTAVTVNTKPLAPTVTSPVNYCQNATASQLTATGSNLKWYITSVGGTGSSSAPTPSTISTGTTYYYVSQTGNTCESPRTIIAVNVNAIPNAPTFTSPVTYCQNANASQLTATGSNLLWYTTSTGSVGVTIAPIPLTKVSGNSYYYVSQTVNTCESQRAMIAVTVNSTPSAPTVTSYVTYCQNATASQLTATGSNLLWYNSAAGGSGSLTAPTLKLVAIHIIM